MYGGITPLILKLETRCRSVIAFCLYWLNKGRGEWGEALGPRLKASEHTKNLSPLCGIEPEGVGLPVHSQVATGGDRASNSGWGHSFQSGSLVLSSDYRGVQRTGDNFDCLTVCSAAVKQFVEMHLHCTPARIVPAELERSTWYYYYYYYYLLQLGFHPVAVVLH